MIDIGELILSFISQYGFTFFLASVMIGFGTAVVAVSMVPWNLFSIFQRKKLKGTILTFIREHENEMKSAVLKHQKRRVVNH